MGSACGCEENEKFPDVQKEQSKVKIEKIASQYMKSEVKEPSKSQVKEPSSPKKKEKKEKKKKKLLKGSSDS